MSGAPFSSDSLRGRTLGEFVLHEPIGAGGFGVVYRAEQPLLAREAVVKVLATRHTHRDASLQRFLREARLASRLDHPFAAHIYAFGAETDGLLWIAMEYVRGTPLDEWLERHGPFKPSELSPLLDRLAEVIHTAHEHGIVHRDIKPSNVMVLPRAGRLLPKLLDLGVAKLIDTETPAVEATGRRAARSHEVTADTRRDDASTSDERFSEAETVVSGAPARPRMVVTDAALTQQGANIGSPAYMAPELWVDSSRADARSDLYALGVLCFQAIEGVLPFRSATIPLLIEEHTSSPVPRSRVPELDEFFGTAMAKMPEARFESALALADRFRAAVGLARSAENLPRLDPALKEPIIAHAPEPIAEAVAAIDLAENAHQARDAVLGLVSLLARTAAALALASWARAPARERALEAGSSFEQLRALRRHELGDQDWIALARQLCRPFADQPFLHPLPALVDWLCRDQPFEEIWQLRTAGAAPATDRQTREWLSRWIPEVARLLASLTFLLEHALVVRREGRLERWNGLRNRRRIDAQEPVVAEGKPVLLDSDGQPLLLLWPLLQAAVPTAGVAAELFVIDGPGRQGARLRSPSGFLLESAEVWDWLSAELLATSGDDEVSTRDDDPPYLGLAPFGAEQADRFVGREREVMECSNRLRVAPVVAVVGASGAGKSSFVRAGVVPSLPPGWRAVSLRPGSSPLAMLAARLVQAGLAAGDLAANIAGDPAALGALLSRAAAEAGPVLLVIDQLEEIFTLCRDAGERRLFAETIAGVARTAEDPVRLIVTLRDDFLVAAEQMPALHHRLSPGLLVLTVPARQDLLRILVEPARRRGYEFEDPDLPAEMVDEVADRPGALPLLSFTAAMLWERRDRSFRRLTRSAYRSLGGVGGALAQHAETTLAEMPADQRRLTREAFRHLVTAHGTRAVLQRKELDQLLGGGEAADAVIERLIAARLLSASEDDAGGDLVEIIHEALLTAWPRLVEWRSDDAEGARLRDQLRATARQWDERGRPRGLLWRDDALAEYRRWRTRHADLALTAVEAAFAGASTREATRVRRIRRTSLAVIAAAAAAALVLLLWLNERAERQRERAEENLLGLYEEQGRQALLARDYFRSLAYLSAAHAGGRRGPALRFMLAEALRPLRQRPLVLAHRDAPTWVAFSPDGSRLVTVSSTAPAASLWSTDGTLLHDLGGHRAGLYMAAFDPSGALAATAGRDGSARLFSAADGAPVATLEHPRSVPWAAFSPAGDLLATACLDGQVRLYRRDGSLVAVMNAGAAVSHLSFSPSGALLVSAGADGRARIWQLPGGTPVRTLEVAGGPLRRAEFAPDSGAVATAGADGTVRIHPVSGEKPPLAMSGHLADINDLAFSPDGALLVTASADGTARLWQAASGRLVASLEAHGDAVMSAVFSPDGTHVLTGSWDGTARVWDRSGTPLGVLVGHSSLVYRAIYDPRGERIATVGIDGSARIWSGTLRSTVRYLVGHQAPVKSASFSADGRRLLSVASDHTARVWQVATGRELERLAVGDDVSWGLFLPGDRLGWVVDRRVRVADAGGEDTGRFFDADSAILWAETSRRGDHLLTISVDRRAIVWDLASARRLAAFPAVWARLAQDGRTVIAIGVDGQVEVWDGPTGVRRRVIRAHRGPSWYALPCEGGRRILSMGADGTLRHWETATGALLRSVSLKVNYVGFEATDDCHFVAAMGDRHLVSLLDAASGQALDFVDARSSESVLITMDPPGTRVAAVDGDRIGVWDIELASESPDEIAAWTRCAVPFRVVGSELVAASIEEARCASR